LKGPDSGEGTPMNSDEILELSPGHWDLNPRPPSSTVLYLTELGRNVFSISSHREHARHPDPSIESSRIGPVIHAGRLTIRPQATRQ